MLSEEEKKAIEYIKNCLDDEFNFKHATRYEDKKVYNVILLLIEKQQAEIEKWKELANKNLQNEIILREKNEPEDIFVLQAEIEKKDKIIEEMISHIEDTTYIDKEECEFEDKYNIKCKKICDDCILEYFTKKVKGEQNDKI